MTPVEDPGPRGAHGAAEARWNQQAAAMGHDTRTARAAGHRSQRPHTRVLRDVDTSGMIHDVIHGEKLFPRLALEAGVVLELRLGLRDALEVGLVHGAAGHAHEQAADAGRQRRASANASAGTAGAAAMGA